MQPENEVSSSRAIVGSAASLLLGIVLFYTYWTPSTRNGDVNVDLDYRVASYPQTHISQIDVDVTSPNHWVYLNWVGPNADKQNRGPFRSCPGAGLGNNDCSSESESNRPGSKCTPLGLRTVVGVSDSLPSVSTATYVTYIDMSRAVAFHYYPEVPDYPASSGCIRLPEAPARLIHNNSIVGKTTVHVSGTWTRPVDRQKLRENLISMCGLHWRVHTLATGAKSIGVGFRLDRGDARDSIAAVGADIDRLAAGKDELSDSQVYELLGGDIESAISDCHNLFSNFHQLSELRQRVLVNVAFLGGEDLILQNQMLLDAVQHLDHNRIADAIADLRPPGCTESESQQLAEQMRTNIESVPKKTVEPRIRVDSAMTREQALEGVSPACPIELLDQQELVAVEYYSSDGRLHRGQLLIHSSLARDIQVVFQIAKNCRFPIESVIPAAAPQFRRNKSWSDEASMLANNTTAFNFRASTEGNSRSPHSYGRAIDINPALNPYIKEGKVIPAGASYNPSRPGTLTASHPVVQAFTELGWQWGGFWQSHKDYQHFEKPDTDR